VTVTGAIAEPRGRVVWTATRAAVAAWVLVVGAGVVVGGHLAATHPAFHVDAAPFMGRWKLVLQWPSMALLALAGAAVLWGPRLARQRTWRWLLVAGFAAAAAWTIALAASEGVSAIGRPVRSPAGYLAGVPLVGSPTRFLSTFTSSWMQLPTHVKAHPPGYVLVLWSLHALGLGGAGWAAAFEVVGGALAVPAVLVTVREVASEAAARRAAPFIAFAPAAIWATSADAVFAAVIAWATAAVVLATGRHGVRSRRLAAGGGVLWGAALMLTYGAALLALVPLALAWSRRRLDAVVRSSAAAVAVLASFAVAGFWWPAGLEVTHQAYLAGIAPHRPYSVFVWLDLAAFAAAIGPVAAPSLVRLRAGGAPGLVALVGAVLVALALADLSGLAKGEVERIWLPWVPWVLAASATLPASIRVAQRWLGVQIAFAVGLELVLRSSW
jgi:hypothetical protein